MNKDKILNQGEDIFLSIIIPVYNEEKTIIPLIETIFSVTLLKQFNFEILIINDFSTDNTADVIRQFLQVTTHKNIQFFEHSINQGKGAALHTGFAHARGQWTIIQDADQEYDPNEYEKLLEPIREGKADVVYGSRFTGDSAHRILFFWHMVGNKFLTLLSNMFTNLNLTDMETCYKVFRSDIIKSLKLREKRFGFEPEVTAKISKIKGIRIYEVGISYYGRTYAEGKKIGWKDGFKAIYCIIRYNLF